MKKKFLLCAVVLGLIAPGALLAQSPNLLNLTGLERVRIVLQNGSAVEAGLNHIRNSAGYALVGAGATVNSTATLASGNLIATGAITTWNVTLPNPAYDGMVFGVSNSTAAAFTTNTTVTAVAGQQTQTLAVAYSGQTLAANGGRALWQFSGPTGTTGTWYRIQ